MIEEQKAIFHDSLQKAYDAVMINGYTTRQEVVTKMLQHLVKMGYKLGSGCQTDGMYRKLYNPDEYYIDTFDIGTTIALLKGADILITYGVYKSGIWEIDNLITWQAQEAMKLAYR